MGVHNYQRIRRRLQQTQITVLHLRQSRFRILSADAHIFSFRFHQVSLLRGPTGVFVKYNRQEVIESDWYRFSPGHIIIPEIPPCPVFYRGYAYTIVLNYA